MKTTITLVAFILCINAKGQVPSWLWAHSAGDTDFDLGTAIAADASGNTYLTGGFSGSSIYFGTFGLNNNSTTYSDVFVVKYDAAGNVVWAKSAGGLDHDFGLGIAVDNNGNCYITGFYVGFNITFGSVTLTNNGGGDVFVVKYDVLGNVVWAKSAGDNDNDRGNCIAVDSNGNSYVTGTFGSGSITFGTITLLGSGPFDIFTVKYDPSGNVIWAKSAGGNDYDYGLGIACDNNGCYLTGAFSSNTITFGSVTLTNTGDDDFFVVKYDISGNVIWAKRAGGSDSDMGHSIATDGSGNSYITGYFRSSNLTFGSVTLTNTGDDDVFVVKYNALGNVAWAHGVGGMDGDYGYGIAADGSSNTYLTGFFGSSNITFGSYTLSNVSDNDIFVVKYNSSGNVVWAKSAGGTSSDIGNGITVDTNGNSYITGEFSSSTVPFGSVTLTNNGLQDFFIAKLSTTVSIEELELSGENIQIFPNPLTTHSQIIINNPNKEKFLFTLYDIIGRVTESVSTTKNEIILTKDSKPAGVYLFNLANEKTGESWKGKVIIAN